MSNEMRQDLLERALAAYRSTDNELAESLAKKILQLNDDDREAHMILGSLYGRELKYSQAINQFYRALEGDADHPEAWNNIGAMYRALGQLPQALEALEKALALDPKNAGVLYNLGNVYKQLDRKHEASEAYEQSLKYNPRNAGAYNNLGTIYENQGDLAKAQDTYQRGLEVDPNHPTLRYNLGLVYQKNNEHRLARQSFESALKGRPGWKAGLNNLGITLQKMGNKDEAQKLFQEMVADNPDNPEALNNLGMLHLEAGRTKEAENQFAQALKINPRYARAALNLDALYFKDGRMQESLDLLSRFSLLEPDNMVVRLQLAKVRLLQGKPEKAEEDLLAVLGKQADNLDALRTLGNLYLKTKRAYLAQKVSDRIERVDPSNVELHMDMALFAMSEGDTGLAIEEVKLFLRAQPGDINARLLLANLYHKQGRSDDARNLLEKLRIEDPQNTAVLGALARIHQESGDQKGALQLADAILQVQGTKSAEDELTLMMETLEMYEKSAESLGEEMKETWDRNLRTLAEPLKIEAEEPEAVEEQRPLVEEPDWMLVKNDPNQTSLLDLGDLNPVIMIDEEDESMILREEDEILPPFEFEDDTPPEEEKKPEPPPPPQPLIIQMPPQPMYPPPVYPPPSNPPPPPAPRPDRRQYRPPEPPRGKPQVREERPPRLPEPPEEPRPTRFDPPPLPEDEPTDLIDDILFEPEGDNPDLSPPPELASGQEEVEEAESPEDDEEIPVSEQSGRVADLMAYLGNLSSFLPEEKRLELEADEIPLKIDRLRRTLSSSEAPTPPPHQMYPQKGEDIATTKRKLQAIMQKLKDKLGE